MFWLCLAWALMCPQKRALYGLEYPVLDWGIQILLHAVTRFLGIVEGFLPLFFDGFEHFSA